MNRLGYALAALILLQIPSGGAAVKDLPRQEQVAADLRGPFATSAAQPLLSGRGPLARRLEPLMLGQARHLLSWLHEAPGTSGALSMTRSASDEHSIRPNAHAAFGFAVLFRAVGENYPPGTSPELFRDRAIDLLRFILPTHGAGGARCSDGKPWRDQWQSAYWAGRAGLAAWLLWDELDPQMQWLAARMISDEADRFLGKTPPAQLAVDTKAEENAWNSTVLSLAAAMFPGHPHAPEWEKAASIWQLSAVVRQEDLAKDLSVAGHRLREVAAGPNIFNDFTLENHHRVHPDYMSAMTLNRYQRLPYAWGGKEVPASVDFNTTAVLGVLNRLGLPDGGFIYPNGQDWQIHRNPMWVNTFAPQMVIDGDPAAALLFRICLGCAEKMAARGPTGRVYLAEEYSFPSTEPMMLDQHAEAYLLLRGWGEGPEPLAEDEYLRNVSGLSLFETGKFALLRTPRSAATFSWGPQVMGMVLPLSTDLLLNPNERSLVGSVSVEGVTRDHPNVLQARALPLGDGFAVTGVLDRAEGKVEQRFAFVALPDGRAVYVDSFHTSEPARLRSLDAGTLGILNEPHWIYHDGTRTVHTEEGSRTYTGTGEAESDPVVTHSRWCNVDDMLGIVSLGPNPRQVYLPLQKPTRSRLEQILHLNSIDPEGWTEEKNSTGRRLVGRSILVFYPNQLHDATRQAAEQTRVEAQGPEAGRIALPGGVAITYDLEKGEIGFRAD